MHTNFPITAVYRKRAASVLSQMVGQAVKLFKNFNSLKVLSLSVLEGKPYLSIKLVNWRCLEMALALEASTR